MSAILLGLIAGTAVGLFLGDGARVFEPVADGFVQLLQMAVLPYLTVSIVASIGSLQLQHLRMLGSRVALVLLGLWTLALVYAFLMPLAFPPTQSASFFSTTLLERPPPFDLVDLYIPANPFFALANNIVPAVVLFSMVVGMALNGVPRKQTVLDVLETGRETLGRVMRFMIPLMPYGVFAIAAHTSGTLRLEQVARLEVYLLGYGTLALLLGLWVLPGLVSALTPIPAREIFRATREPLFTAVIAGDLFIVLPVIIASCKELVARYGSGDPATQTLPDVIVPVSFNFPHSGKLLSVSFVLFAAWFSDAAIAAADYPRLGLTAVVSLFGSITAAMPFLLDAFRVPADTFQLFIASGVVNSRFGTLVAAMHTVTMALVGTCAATGMLRWRPRALARFAVVTVILTVAAIGGLRVGAGSLLGGPRNLDVLATMSVAERAETVVHSGASPLDPPPAAGVRLRVIDAAGRLRVGYLADALPFAFFNAKDDLVGFDVALVHGLARDLGTRLEFVPIARGALDRPSVVADLLRNGSCDIVVGGMAVTTERAEVMQLTSSYLDETLGFVVPDGARRRFESWPTIRADAALTIAAPDVPYYVDTLRARLPHARIQTFKAFDELFNGPAADVDAIAITAERGSAWTLRHPQYSVVVPSPEPIRVPLAFALPPGELELAAFVNTWLALKAKDGTIARLYEYWILGRDAVPDGPRWSIIRDVLHWVE
jgi:Na+/H+-dicarboxylate symporter